MDLSGNKNLLGRYLVAFFASRTAPTEALAVAEQWALAMAQTNKIIISGFRSLIERAVLDVLLANGCSVVVAMGRSLYRQIPAHLQEAYEEGRVLFVSFRNSSHSALYNSQIRDRLIADLANEIVFAPFDTKSQLSSLHSSLVRNKTRCVILR